MRRVHLVVRGVVQGVGFRPFVAGLARRLGLGGMVRNDAGAVVIEVEGPRDALDAFSEALTRDRPPLAVIDSVTTRELAATGEATFHIETSGAAEGRRTSIPPDVATCDACLREMRDPGDRRFRYPFLNCTHCGPRFTIIQSLPYDRATTTMRRFEMCEACRAEYEDPENRRYHAEPTACPECGPHVWFDAPGSARIERDAAIRTAQDWLGQGRIVAVKGIGGFHLACLAESDEAVTALRKRKGRGDKPFALMAPTMEVVRALCEVDGDEAVQLQGRARPIVLLRRRADAAVAISRHVAPGQDHLGFMLPYSPLHHLLLTDRPLVMTSGNRSDEPIAKDNDEAREKLAALADAFLFHDRDIHTVCDDSVIRVFRGEPLPVRRSRGFAPFPVRLPFEVPPVLGVGGELKATFCLAQGRDAYLSQHIGDMETMETLAAFERAVANLSSLFEIAPTLVAIDPHPGYLSSRWAAAWARERGVPVVPVQHHHAHHGAVMAEHGLDADARVIGVVFDGTGYGLDGAVWGGEVFVGGYAHVRRAARLKNVTLPASDVDVRHGYRLALAHLAAAGIPWDESLPAVQACPARERALLARRFARGVSMVTSSSMGRLFDAVSSLVGVRHVSAYEAQAAIELEAVAANVHTDEVATGYAFELVEREGLIELDPSPVLRAIVEDLSRGTPAALISARFHEAVAQGVRTVVQSTRVQGTEVQGTEVQSTEFQNTGVQSTEVRRTEVQDTVVLSGGVFQNVRLLGRTVDLLAADGFRVLTHRLVPPNDGGLALGQAVCAARTCDE
jgi:hydrogenase maturation protein HypF